MGGRNVRPDHVKRLTRRQWLAVLVVIGVPCFAVQLIHQVHQTQKDEKLQRQWDAMFQAQATVDRLKESQGDPEALRHAEDALRIAMTNCHNTLEEPTPVQEWLRISTAMGLFLVFWSIVGIACKKQKDTRCHS